MKLFKRTAPILRLNLIFSFVLFCANLANFWLRIDIPKLFWSGIALSLSVSAISLWHTYSQTRLSSKRLQRSQDRLMQATMTLNQNLAQEVDRVYAQAALGSKPTLPKIH